MTEQPALTVAEVATLTGWSRQTVTRLFEKEPGVLMLRSPESLHKRSYRSIRIPRQVYERVIWALSVKAERHRR
jgi:predicted DNA-binding transcriptional regulator AlpA